MKPIKCGVIGVGHLGKHHADKYDKTPGCELTFICDTNIEHTKALAQKYNVQTTQNYYDLIGQVDAVSIVTPTSSHYEVAKCMLDNGIDVLIEKPIAVNLKQADELINLAKKNTLIIQVGHIERFNPAFIALKSTLTKPLYIDATRIAPFSPRNTDVSVTLDLMIHSIDLIQNIMPAKIDSIQANGASILTHDVDIANARIQFKNGAVANITASRISFATKREMRIFQPNSFIFIDYQNKSLSLHQKGPGEMYPGIAEIITKEERFEENDALLDEIHDFIRAVTTRSSPLVSGEDGRRALATAITINDLIQESQHDRY